MLADQELKEEVDLVVLQAFSVQSEPAVEMLPLLVVPKRHDSDNEEIVSESDNEDVIERRSTQISAELWVLS